MTGEYRTIPYASSVRLAVTEIAGEPLWFSRYLDDAE
jgi:hypothetical protein